MIPRRNVLLSLLILSLAFSPLALAQPLADRIPDDALIYIAWRGADDPGSSYAQSRLKAFLDASAIPQLFSDTLPRALDKAAEKDRGAAIFREVIGKLGPSFWRSPTAFYVGPVDGIGTPQPFPRLALLCQAGAGAPQLKRDINSYLDQVMAGGPQLPVVAVEEAGIVAVTFGNVTLDLSGKSNTSLVNRKEFTDAMAQVGRDPMFALYADVESAITLVDRAASLTGPGAQKWTAIRDTLGLGGLKRIAWTAGFDGRDFATQGLVLAPAPRTGLLQLLDSGPISDDSLRAVPLSATTLVAGKFDLAKLLDIARDLGPRLGIVTRDQIDSGLAIANVTLGTNLEQDLIRSLGDDWIMYDAPTVGGVGPLGLVLVNHARDAARLESALSALELTANRMINMSTSSGQPRANFVRGVVNGVNVHYINTPVVTPSWAVKDGNLYIALYPQTAASAAVAAAAGGKSILDNPEFQAMRKRLTGGSGAASEITFYDLPRSAPVGYPYALAASRLLGFADMFGVQTPAAVLPTLDQIMPLMSPSGSASWTDATGAHERSVSPFPCATLLAGPEAIFLEGEALAASVIMPTYAARQDRARQSAERAQEQQRQLQQEKKQP
jgi:hypothetical protein